MTSQGLFRADFLLDQCRLTGPVLGLETGGPQASLALSSHGKIIAADTPARRAHGESIVGAVDGLLHRSGLRLRDLTAIAVGIGPGSFTGLRIALSYAKGVALATGCGVAGVPSLDALALCALELSDLPPEAMLCPILDARKGEVYAALYRRVENGLEKVSGEFLAKPGDLARRLEGAAVFFGDGAACYGDLLNGVAGRDHRVLTDFSAAPPPAAMIAALGAARVSRGQLDAAASLQPLYVRPSEAELKAKCPAGDAGLEALWSREKKSSSANTQTTTRS
ncbi:MAG TPA: tRNA (adenosine(37)-N6)-threonylcarbamoyltransferase complex dimerization subunit type 1 TsaB [Candidatus Binataceae bacterium]|nr:tRNA (adenosine(37)-N6)-threonylcarbamoyltransferase complex dimerization subunit type 1 TsaB [Candidatus Binataceae bacterium]